MNGTQRATFHICAWGRKIQRAVLPLGMDCAHRPPLDISSNSSHPLSAELLSKFPAGRPGTYVLNSSLCSKNEKFAVALSNYMAVVYDAQNNQIAEYVHNNVITDIKFSSKDPSLLFTSSLDGKINVWDSRCNEAVQTFLDNSSGVPKPLLCFDYNSDESYVSAGTEIIREDAFLLFWDRRSSNCLGGYWNGHTDDITQVQFNSRKPSMMASASLDGLINLYDLNKSSEDEAITYTGNVGTGVNKLINYCNDTVECITTLDAYQFWSAWRGDPMLSITKTDLSRKLKWNVDYIIDKLFISDSWTLATGSYDGTVHLSVVNLINMEAQCCLTNGHTDVVRTICCNSKSIGSRIKNQDIVNLSELEYVVYTGGEDGYICQWKVSGRDRADE